MKILKDICRDLFNDLAGIEALCTEAIYATEKQIKEGHILDDIRYSADFRTMAASYENKKNFMLLIKRELQEEALLLAQGKTFTDRELVKISRLFLKESKSSKEKIARISPILYMAVCEMEALNKSKQELNLQLKVSEEDNEVLRRITFYQKKMRE